jgi:hypothetical protein
MRARIDLSGQRFGKLTVRRLAYRDKGHRAYFKCVCDCGKEVEVRSDHLRSGKILACGCLIGRHHNGGGRTVTHGNTSFHRRTVEYKAWDNMRSRCCNTKRHNYKNYGGRGIKVCDRWLNSFENFLADIGRKPGPEYSVDRINNDGNYEPGNCRWATPSEQRCNQGPHRLKEAS